MRIKCYQCAGTGQVAFRNTKWLGLSSILTAKCPSCYGLGWWEDCWIPLDDPDETEKKPTRI